MLPLTHLLVQTHPRWAKLMASMAESVMRAVVQSEERTASWHRVAPTQLTGANWRSRQYGVRRGAKPERPVSVLSLPPACLACGVLLDNPECSYCDACLPERREQWTAIFAKAGPNVLTDLQVEGKDPAHGGEVGRKRGRADATYVRSMQGGNAFTLPNSGM